VKLPGRRAVEAEEHAPQEKSRLCPECGAPVSIRATTCANCGYDFVAARRAEQMVQAEQREEAAQRPVRAIAVGVTAAIVLLLIAALYLRNRAEAIAALTPTATPTSSATPTPSRSPTPTDTPPFTTTPIPPREYIVQPGDTIFYIADIFQVSYQDILAFNNLTERSILQVNQKILIPPPTPTPTLSPTPPGVTPVLSPTPVEIIHIVQPGETLIAIAQEYGVTVEAILGANNIQNPDQIKAGDQLVIPQSAAPAATLGPGTPTPLPGYDAVTLLQPIDGNRIVGGDDPVLLQWLSSGVLRDTEFYRVNVEQIEGSILYGPVYIKATALHLPASVFPAPDDSRRRIRWTVNIVRQAGVGSDGVPLYNVVSPPSSRIFQWLPAPAPPTLTPAPPR
jgi:LysM repeat protein